MKIIFRYIHGKEWAELALGLLLIAFQARLDLLFPEYMKDISALLQDTNTPFSTMMPFFAGMLACIAATLLCALGSAYIISRLSALAAMRIRRNIFSKVASFSMKEVNEFTVPSLLSRCTFDVTQIQTFIANLPHIIVRAPLTGIIAAVNLSSQNYVWTSIVAGVVAFMIIFVVVLMIMLTPKMKIITKLNDKLNRVSLEHLTGLRVIHAYNAYDYQRERFTGTNTPLTDVNIYVNSRISSMYPVFTFLVSFGQILIYLTGAYMIISAGAGEKLAVFSNMMVAFFYSMLVVNSFLVVILIMIQLPRMIVSADRVNEVIDAPVSIVDGTSNDIEHKGTVEFSHVSFRYPGASADSLKDITFTAGKGQTVALIGSTGCGKTSILNLIPRLYDVSEGKILVDGADVKSFNLHDLRGRIGYVPQKNILFSGTIEENISYGGDSSLDDVQKAAEIGQAEEFITQRPEGYNSTVERGGSNFSGGQKQRLTISRAIYKDPEIYLFDDSFSALDLMTDKKLREALRENSRGATVIIAAQRVSTVINADKIIVIDKGRIAGEGKHEDLMKTCSIYQEIAKSQMGQGE